MVAYYVETNESRVAYHDSRAQSRKKYSRKEKNGADPRNKHRRAKSCLTCVQSVVSGKVLKSTTVKRKRGRPKKQTEASFGRSEELPDMCAEHGLGKSSDVERKRIRLGEVLILQQLLTKGVGWFTIKPSVTIVALGRRRYSYHSCVECGKKGLQDAEWKYGCVEHPEAETKQTYRLRVLLQ